MATALPLELTRARFRPALLWAPLGGVLLVLIAVTLADWVAGGVHSVRPGPDEFGGTKLVVLRLVEWAQFVVFAYLVWRFCIRPVISRAGIGFDGLFILVAFTMNFWDPLDNFWTFAFQYNAHFLNVGSWGAEIPGWHSEGAESWAVPLAFIFGCYTWAWFAAVRLGSWILDRLRAARPAWSRARCFGVVYLVAAAQSGLSEVVFLRLEHWTYPTTVDGLTAFQGHTYAWPFFNPAIYGLTWVAMIWLRDSVDEDGLSSPERGIATSNVPTWSKPFLRYAAIVGFTSVVYIVTYFLPFNLLVAHGDMARDLPSYFPVP